MPQDCIQKAIDQVPELTDFGIGIFEHGRGLTPTQRTSKFQEYQQKLLDSAEEFEKTCEWLSTKERRKTINKSHTSYGLKHMAERDIGYITNGVFIAAAIHCGFKIQFFHGSANVCINISEKALSGYLAAR